MAELRMQTKQLKVIKVPKFHNWAVKKRRTQFTKYVGMWRRNPSTFSGTYTQLLTYPEPCFLSNQIGLQISDNESKRVCTDAMGSPNMSPKPNTKKRKLDCCFDIPPFYFIQSVDSSPKEVLHQFSRVGGTGRRTLCKEGLELACCSEKLVENQHLFMEPSPEVQLFEPNSDCSKTFANLVDGNITGSAYINNGTVINIATHQSYVDSCYREDSPLSYLGSSPANVLPVQETEMFCCSEKIGENQHLVIEVSPRSPSFEPNSDWYRTRDNLISENADAASINKERLPIQNSASIVSHMETGPKRLANICDPLAPSTPQNNIQNRPLVGNTASNPCMHKRVEISQGKETNLLSSEISPGAASPSLGGKDAFEKRTLHLHPKDGLLAIGPNTARPPKSKRKKHQPKIRKDGIFVKISRLKNQVDSTRYSKQSKKRNSRGNRCQPKAPTSKKEDSENFHSQKSNLLQPVMDVSSATNGEIFGSSENSRSQTVACWNDVAIENEYNGLRLQDLSPVLYGKTKKAKLKDLARQKKVTISKSCIENKGTASGLMSQIVPCIDVTKGKKIKGKRTARKRSGSVSRNAENCLCLADSANSGKSFINALNAIQDRLRNLSLNEEQVRSLPERQEMIPLERKDELIPHEESLSLIPYDHSFDSMNIKKIRPRVLLDSETNRVWNLLMGKGEIEDEAEGNEMTERWWKQERHTFKTRAENFIACMRVVQGNRQFSPWKGSVVDSVIGAFLTQNVSDHLSSSAFIALASQFPIDENNRFDTTDPEGMESMVLNNTPYYVSCEVDGQSQEMLRERVDSTESYKSSLSVEDSISYHYKNSVADDRHEVPWPRSPTSDLLTVTDGSNSCEESVHNPISSHASSFDTNEEQDVMPAHMPFSHFRSCSDSNCIAEVQVNESTLKNSCTDLAETRGEVSLNLQKINRSFQSSACHDTVALDDRKDSNGSNNKGKMIESNMMSNSHDDHNSNSQTTINLCIGPPQHLESRFPDKTCETLITRHETVSDINLVSLENEPAENEIGFPKFNLQMALCNSQCRADSQPKPNGRTNFEIMKVEECRVSNTIQNDDHNSIKQNQFLDGTVELGTESSQNQGSRLDGKTCEQISLQREVQDLTSQIVENMQGENTIGNAIFCGQMAPNYLVLTIQPSKNPLLLQRYEAVPDLTVDLEENEPAEEELGNAKYYGKMAEDNLELSGEAQLQPDRRQNVDIMKLEDEERNVSVALDKNSSTYTHFEQDHAHSNANTGSPYKDRLGSGSVCQESAVSSECNNFSQNLPYDFLERSSQERHQANSFSGCQSSSLTEESQVAASALCSLAQQGNSMAFSENLIPLDNRASDELSFELTLSSTPPDALITNNLAVVVPKGRRSTRRSGYVKKLFGKTSGIERGTMEMNQGAFKKKIDWEVTNKNAREIYNNGNAKDAVNWEAVRCADIEDIADAIKPRGMNFLLAGRIKVLLNVLHKEHGSINLEWLKNMPPEEAKNFLLSIRGLGLKSVECIRLLTLQQMAFPVDTNVGRIVVRLGWVPLEPLPESLQIHLLEKFPLLDKIQKYLWPRLCTLDQRTLYELHYQMITFGKVFCTKSKPNCNACPMKLNCRHFASAYASARLALPAPDTPSEHNNTYALSFDSPQVLAPISSINVLSQQNLCTLKQLPMAYIQQQNYEPIIEEPIVEEPIVEEPPTPESFDSATHESSDIDYEEMFNVYLSDKSHTLQIYNPSDTAHRLASSMALVPVPFEAANIPVPKLKTITRLRTEHRVYEIPDNHQLLDGLEPRLKDDPSSYLLAIWSPGETSEPCCISNGSHDYQCEQESCRLCTNMRGTNDETVKGTLLIPCRTAMRGRFPLNGTYFQVNEVFADHETSVNPLEVPRAWIWNLQQTTVYFGSSIPSIMRGLSKEEIQKCFWRGYVCVRGFEKKKRSPERLVPRLHSPLSRKVKDQNGHVKYDDASEEI